MKKKVLFLGTKPIGFQCLQHLLASCGDICEVVGVLTKENKAFGSDQGWGGLCKEHRIPLINDLEAIVVLEDIDFMISVQYHNILKARHIDVANELAINLHMAPLPEYRGANQFSYAIINGDAQFGTTLHQIDEGIDSGHIMAERRFDIPKGAFIKDLYELTFDESVLLFEENIRGILKGDYTLTPQVELEAERGTSLHFRKEINELKKIDLQWDREKIERHIRATAMPGFPPPYAMLGEKKIEFTIIE